MKKLTAFQVAIALATTHYGLGFLIGTGQDIAEFGPGGMLYAFSTAIGLLTLIPIIGYYWKSKKPIWDIFQSHHGNPSAKLTAFLSSFWMVGVIASQILGGSAALMAFGISRSISTVIIAGLILGLSYIELGKLSKVFFYFLIFSSIIVIFSALRFGLSGILTTPLLFVQSVPSLPIEKLLGVFLTTIFITFIGMDIHQFLIAAESESAAKKGALGGFFILAFLTILLGSAILGFLKSDQFFSHDTLTSAQVVPQMLMSTGSTILGGEGIFLFLLPIILVSAGSGSVVTKVVVSAIKEIIPRQTPKNTRLLPLAIVCTSVVLTTLSQSVVGLVVSFYATYVGAVLLPFFVVLLEERSHIQYKNGIFFNAILLGFICSLITFVSNRIGLFETSDISLFMLFAGFCGSAAIFLTASTAESTHHFLRNITQKEKNKGEI